MTNIGKLKIITIPETLCRIFGLKDSDLVEVEVKDHKAILKPIQVIPKIKKETIQVFVEAIRNFPKPKITLTDSPASAREHDKYIYTKQ